ncbi:MAG: hypothetical protein IJ881_06690 [Neisseriaceae bacterium]|nr:hypothetical protein [Neisseriaceae bacterium]
MGINRVILKRNGDMEVPFDDHVNNSSNNDTYEDKISEEKPQRPRRTIEQLKELDNNILRLKKEGKSRKEIARECDISEVYVSKRLGYIFDPSNL